jgi:hypothetical protein
MLPELKILKKKTRKLKLPNESYFELADEYVHLKDQFILEDPIEIIYSWIDMVFYPVYIVIQLCMLEFSAMYIITLSKTYQLWINWFRLQELENRLTFWKHTVRSVGGPWISTNNPDYHVFVYADGMQRIKDSQALPRSFQKTEKTSPEAQHPVQSQVSSPPKSPSVPSEVPLVP